MTRILNKWSIVESPDPYIAPECRTSHLHGLIYGDSRFKDGDEVITTPIHRVENETIITKSGSVYLLGYTDPNYEKAFPNARERIFNYLNQK